MIFVDTSVWIAAFRDAAGPCARQLSRLLDSDDVALSIPVFLEILAGSSKADRPRMRETLTSIPLFYPTDSTWRRVEAWIEAAGDAGKRFGFADLLIGAIALENDASLWSLDSDFERMARLKFMTLFNPA